MPKFITVLISITSLLCHAPSYAYVRFGETLCKNTDYFCITTKPHDTWNSLFPSDKTRDIAMRVNRMNIALHSGMTIAIPKRLDEISIYDVSPFPRYIEPTKEKVIFVVLCSKRNQFRPEWMDINESLIFS